MSRLQKIVLAAFGLAMAAAGYAQATAGRAVPSIERDMGTFTNANGDWLFLGATSSGRPYYMLGDQQIMLTEQEGGLLVSEDGAELAITRNDNTTFKAIDLRAPDGAHTIYEYLKSYEVLETTVESRSVQLQCTYIEPLAPGPHPALVFAHGSGPNLRSRYMYAIWKFAVAGVASFACDKRGSGGSGGDLLLAGFDDLADDLIRSVQHVASSYNIETARLGVVGISQAGWVMPIAASREPSIQFVISISGSGMPLAVQEHYLVENNLKNGGFGDTAIRWAHQMIRVINSGIRTLQSEKLQALGLVVPKLDKYFYPATVWPKLTQPTLAIFGSHDRHVPPGASSMILSEPVPSTRTYAPGYFSAMTTWITNDFELEEAIPGLLDEAEILAAAESEAIRSPYASITSHFLTMVSLLVLIFLAAVVAIGVKPLWRRGVGQHRHSGLGGFAGRLGAIDLYDLPFCGRPPKSTCVP